MSAQSQEIEVWAHTAAGKGVQLKTGSGYRLLSKVYQPKDAEPDDDEVSDDAEEGQGGGMIGSEDWWESAGILWQRWI